MGDWSEQELCVERIGAFIRLFWCRFFRHCKWVLHGGCEVGSGLDFFLAENTRHGCTRVGPGEVRLSLCFKLGVALDVK